MVISVATPRKSITEKVFQKVGGYYHGSKSSQNQRRCSNETDFDYDEDSTMELVQIGAERTKNVLILMSDTGGGHRASAEAIRDAFQIEFGDEYRVIWLESHLGFHGFFFFFFRLKKLWLITALSLNLLILVDLVVLFGSIMFLFVEERNVLCRTCE